MNRYSARGGTSCSSPHLHAEIWFGLSLYRSPAEFAGLLWVYTSHFWGASVLFFMLALLTHASPIQCGVPFSCILTNSCQLYSLMIAIPTTMRWCLPVSFYIVSELWWFWAPLHIPIGNSGYFLRNDNLGLLVFSLRGLPTPKPE